MPTVHDLRGPSGPLEAILNEPATLLPHGPSTLREPQGRPEQGRGTTSSGQGPRAAVVFAHPHPQHGGTMHTKVVYQGAKGLSRIGCAVLRFNFRGVGGSAGTFGRGEGEKEDFRAALDYMAAKYAGVRLWSAGFSFGGWVALEAGAVDDRVSALIGISPPVVTSVSGMDYSFPNTLASEKPKFFIQGEADEVCPLEGMWSFYAKLKEPKELVVIDAANHLFEGKAEEVGDTLADLLGDF